MVSKRPSKLYRDPANAKCMGVCAGMADYLDMKVGAVRILTVLAVLFTGGWPLVFVYFVMGFYLDKKPADMYEDEREEQFWKETRKSPDWSTSELRRRFRDVERRTSEMEAYVTSKRFRLDRELKALED